VLGGPEKEKKGGGERRGEKAVVVQSMHGLCISAVVLARKKIDREKNNA